MITLDKCLMKQEKNKDCTKNVLSEVFSHCSGSLCPSCVQTVLPFTEKSRRERAKQALFLLWVWLLVLCTVSTVNFLHCDRKERPPRTGSLLWRFNSGPHPGLSQGLVGCAEPGPSTSAQPCFTGIQGLNSLISSREPGVPVPWECLSC